MTSGNQFGFKQYHFTETCIFTLKYIIEYYGNLDRAMYICFLDASKAFDKVNHWNLFYKLLNRNVPCIVVRILLCWYTTQLFYVNWDHTLSEPFNVTNGVRQGGILSPILFNVFMDDLSVLLNKEYIGCYLQGVPYNHLVYADDSVLLAPSPSALQKLINICDAYATDVELTYNTKKTVCMSILPKWLKVNNGFQFELSGNTLSYTNEHKYLGVYIRNDCMDGSDIQQQVRSIYARGNIIIAKFSNCDVNVKTRLFKTFCNSFYGANIWTRFYTYQIKKLYSAYNRIFRKFFNVSDRTITIKTMLDYNIDPVVVILRKLSCGFYRRVLSSHNCLLQNIVNSKYFCSSIIVQRWNKDLFLLS